jgi:hypothetical protein
VARIIGQSGSWAYLVDVGEGDWQGRRVPLGRVYERLTSTLGPPAPIDSILARGYWEDVSDLATTRTLVEAEVDALL